MTEFFIQNESELHLHRMQTRCRFIIRNNNIHPHLHIFHVNIRLKDEMCQNFCYAIPCANLIVEEYWHISQNNGSDTGYCSCSMFVKMKIKGL
jgi:hypothetical protein